MKTLLTALTIIALAGTVYAAGSEFELDEDFVLDVTDPNEAFLENTGTSVIEFAGFTIKSAGDLLDYDNYYGLNARQVDGLYTWLADNFGNSGIGFGPANPGSNQITELQNTGYAVFQPGFRFSLGNCAPNGTDADLDITYLSPGGTLEGRVVPEPATMSLLALGGILGLRRRR